MSEKITVRKSDAQRILHTEVLPYEVPILFSNERLYRYAKNPQPDHTPPLIKALFETRRYSIPYHYEIWQGHKNRRVLSLVHPAWQLQFVEMYQSYSELILSLCSKSTYSLRYPSRVASYYFNRDRGAEEDSLRTETADQEPGVDGEEARHAASFFYYARYAQLYRFIDSPEYLRLESQFAHLTKFDIKRCFASIYTHSLSWAVKGKQFAKDHRMGASFDGAFDRLMTDINYQETNGIVVGPEFSRVFAEIILQQVDLDIANGIAASGVENERFAIRRYIDDYFVFTRTLADGEKIQATAEKMLEQYKLYVNEAKTETFTLPFITPQTIAKTDVQSVLNGSVLSWLNYLKRITKDVGEVSLGRAQAVQLKTPYKLSARIMRDLKIAVKRSGVSFDVVTSYSLGSVTQSLYRVHKALHGKSLIGDYRTQFQNIIVVTVEIVFFLYSMDFRVRTTYFIAQFMLIIDRITKRDLPFRDFVIASMREHVEGLLDRLPRDERAGIEILNLLIALKALCPNELLSPERLERITLAEANAGEPLRERFTKNYRYFDYITLLQYIGDSSLHADWKESLEGALVSRFRGAADFAQSTELACLFLDVLSCPYITMATKEAIVADAFRSVLRHNGTIFEIRHVINYCRRRLGFTRWGPDINLEKLLRKKQLNPAY